MPARANGSHHLNVNHWGYRLCFLLDMNNETYNPKNCHLGTIKGMPAKNGITIMKQSGEMEKKERYWVLVTLFEPFTQAPVELFLPFDFSVT